jgi:hypothetical protein
MKPVLLILAAGVGSRYGGLKQLDGIGPNGETLMAYSVYDAIRAGFSRVVFVIGESHQSLFAEQILPRYRAHIAVDTVVQRTADLPEGYDRRSARLKPWGTGHAVLSARDAITGPFAVVNADDFYGVQAFDSMAQALQTSAVGGGGYYLMGYRLKNTLSEHGSVSRGICRVENGDLVGITEQTQIFTRHGTIVCRQNHQELMLDGNAVVSMNFWGFPAGVFSLLETHFRLFLDRALDSDGAEFFLNQPLDRAVQQRLIRIRMLETAAAWMGITYAEDKAWVVAEIRRMINEGVYPEKLF